MSPYEEAFLRHVVDVVWVESIKEHGVRCDCVPGHDRVDALIEKAHETFVPGPELNDS